LNITLSGYEATWHPTEQTPESQFGTPTCPDQFCSLDPTAFGKTDRWILGSQLSGDHWRATAYAQYYDWHMLSNSTYEVDTQINQFDRRIVMGGRYENDIVDTESFDVMVGTELRYDNINKVGLDSTLEGKFVDNVSNNNVVESSIGVYGEATWNATKALRFTAGLRGDLYNFDVGVNEGSGVLGADNVGNTSDNIASPKVGVAYTLNDSIELYANWGQGFHSNDARGVNNVNESVPGLVRGTGYEGGARFEVGDFKITAAYWWLNLSSELIFVGDDNSVEPRGSSKRHGYELVLFWRPVEWIGIDAVYTGSTARYDQDQDPGIPGSNHIEGGVENAGEIGISAIKNKWELSARVRYLGPYALLPDNSERADAESMLNLRAAYHFAHITLYGEMLNALDHNGQDIVYWYENAFDPSGGRVSRAEEPRTVRVGVKYRF
jgi:outer membrane receptor protein involved in Fe transport